MKKLSILILVFIAFNSILISQNTLLVDAAKSGVISNNSSKEIIHLNKDKFKKLVFNYDVNDKWEYEGNVPAIIDFYADWCKPCKMVAPTLEELQKEYNGKIQIYKVNTQFEKELASVFGISGIPAFLFVPAKGEPSMATGAMPKASFEKYIKEYLKVDK